MKPDATVGPNAITTEARGELSEGISQPAIYATVVSVIRSLHSGGGTLVDVGCGSGNLWKSLRSFFDSYVGADVVEYRDFPDDGKLVIANLDEDLPATLHDSGDVVTAVEIIEHIENPRAFMRKLVRVAKPGGVVIVTTPNQLSPLSKLSLTVKNQFRRSAAYPAHVTALLAIDLLKIADECGLEQATIRYTNPGKIPFTQLNWPKRLGGRLFSDNALLVARKPARERARSLNAAHPQVPRNIAQEPTPYARGVTPTYSGYARFPIALDAPASQDAFDDASNVIVVDNTSVGETLAQAQPTPPLISAVIPSHNRPESLQRLLASLRRQTCVQIQVIVVDDGSIPALPALEDRIITFRNEQSRGLCAVRNQGIHAAEGSLLVFLDDDAELIHQDCFARAANLAMRHPKAGAIAFRQLRPNGAPHYMQPVNSAEACYAPRFFGYAAMLRTAAVREIGGFDECRSEPEITRRRVANNI